MNNILKIGFKRNNAAFLFFFMLLLNSSSFAQSATYTGTGSWTDAANWSSNPTIPDATYDVTLANGADLTVAANAACKSLTFATTNSNTTVRLNAGITLNVTNNIVTVNPGSNSEQTIDVGAGILTCGGSLTMANTGGNPQDIFLLISTGSVIINGDLTTSGAANENAITFSGNGSLTVAGNLSGGGGTITANTGTINIGGNFNINTFTANTSTVNFNSADAQTIDNVSYYNVTCSGGGTKSLIAGTTILAGGTVTMTSGNLNLAGFDLTMTTTAAFSGGSSTSLVDYTNSGRILQTGNAAAHWQKTYPIGTGSDFSPASFSAVAGTDLNGNLYISVFGSRHALLNGSNNALERYWNFNTTDLTFTSVTGTLTYSDNDIDGLITEGNLLSTGKMNATWSVNQAGSSYNHGTNQITFSATSSITGTWTLGENAGCFDAVLPSKFTVNHGNWNAGATWNGGAIPVAGDNVWIIHTVTRQNAADINPGNVTVTASGVLNLNDQSITISGSTEVYGKIIDGSNTGTNIFTGLVTVYSGGTFSTGSNSPYEFRNGITNNGTFSQTGTGGVSFTTNAQALNSTSTITLGGIITVTGVTVTNNTTVNLTNVGANVITGTGNWTQGNSSILYLTNAQSINVSTFDCDINSNTVVYRRADGTAQAINTSTTYHHLILEGYGNKNVGGALNVNGDLTIQSITTGQTLAFLTTTNNVVVIGNINIINNQLVYFTQTSGTLSGASLNVSGGNSLYFSSNATLSGGISVINGSTLSFDYNAAVYAYNISGSISVDGTSTINCYATNSASAMTLQNGTNLTINGTFSLYTSAARYIDLTLAGTHQFNGTAASITLAGLTLNAAANLSEVDYNMQINRNLTINNGADFNLSSHNVTIDANATVTLGDATTDVNWGSSTAHTVYTNWASSGANFSHTGTITFDGAAQSISAEDGFNDIIFTNQNTKTFTGAVTTAGDLTIQSVTAGQTVTVSTSTNNVIVGGDLIANNNLGAYFTQTTGTLTAVNLKVQGGNTFYFSSNATLSGGIDVNTTSTLSFDFNAAVYSYSVGTGISVDGTSTINCYASNSASSLTLQNGANLAIDGTFSLYNTAARYIDLTLAGVHQFNGSAASITLAGLILNASADLSEVDYNMQINRNLTINNGADFNLSSHNVTIDANATVTLGDATTDVNWGSSTAHTVYTNWASSGANFTHSGTITFDGAAQSISAEDGFNDIIFTNQNTKTFTGAVTTAGDLTIQSVTAGQTVTVSTSTNNVIVGGDLIANNNLGAYFTQTTGTLTAVNLKVQGGNTFYFSSNATLSGGIDVNTTSTLSFDFNALTYTYDINGNFSVDATSTVNCAAANSVSSLTIRNGNALDIDGSFSLYRAAGQYMNLILAGTHTLPGSAAAITLAGLTVNADIDLSATSNIITMNGALTINNGLITLGNNNFYLTSTATTPGVYSASAMVLTNGAGQLVKNFASGASAAFVFPVGENTGVTEYSPVTLTFSAKSLAGNVGVIVTDGTHANAPASDYLSRYWTFTETSGGTYTYQATYAYPVADVSGDESGFQLHGWNGAAWTADLGSITTVGTHSLLSTNGLTQVTGTLNNYVYTTFRPDVYYWSLSAGNWNGGATIWETSSTDVDPAGTGTPTAIVPTYANNKGIRIKHNITVNAATYTADQLVIKNGGTLTLGANDINLYNGTGTDLTIDNGGMVYTTGGQLTAAVGSVTIDNAGTIRTEDADGLDGTANTTVDNTNSPTLTLSAGSIVEYYRNNVQTVTGTMNYKNLYISTSNVKTSNSAIAVDENLIINAATFDASSNNLAVTGTTYIRGGGTLRDTDAGGANSLTNVDFDNGNGYITGNGAGVYDDISISGTLDVSGTGAGWLNEGNITISGNTTIDAGLTLTIDDVDGSKTFNNLTVDGTWDNNNVNKAVTLNGSLTVNAGATFTAGSGIYTLAGAAKNITGTIGSAVTIPTISVSGTYTNQLTNGLTVSTDLDGTGTFEQASGALLTYTGAAAPMRSGTLDADVSTNTVNYNGAAQDVKNTTYHHLSGTIGNVKSLTGHTTVNGDLTINAATFEIGANNLTVSGTTYIQGSTLRDQNAAGTNTLNAVSINSGNGIITGSGAGVYDAFSIASISVSGTGVVYLRESDITVSGTTTINSGRTLNIDDADGSKSFNDITVDGGTWNNSIADPITINGTLTVNTGSTFTAGAGTHTFAGSNKDITGTIATALSIPTLNVTGSYTNQLTNGLTTSTDLDGTGTFTQGASSVLNYAGASAPMRSGTLDANTNSNTVNYNGAAQDVRATTYRYLTLSTSGVKTAAGAFTVSNDLTITGNGTDFYSSAQIDVTGNVTINLTTAATTTSFGGNASTWNIGGNLLITNSSTFAIGVTAGQTKNINIDGNVTVDLGSSLTVTAANATHNMAITNGVLANSGTFDMYNSGVQYCDVNITPNAGMSLGGTSLQFNALTLSDGGAFTHQLTGSASIYSDLIIANNNTLDLNAQTLTTAGNITINSGATLDVDDNADLLIASGKTLTNNGTFKAVGSSGTPANISQNPAAAGVYRITQTAVGAIFHAKFATFDYVGNAAADGITITNGSIDGTNDFDDCSFTNGTGVGFAYLNLTGLNLLGGITAERVTFGAGPSYNARRTAGADAITFADPIAGGINGENYDVDNGNPGSLVRFTFPSNTFHTISSGDFFNPAIWDADPTGRFASADASFQIMNTHDVVLNGDIDVLELTVGDGTSGKLTIGNDATVRNMTVQTLLEIKAGGTLNVGTTGSPTHITNLYGNMINAGTVNLRNPATNKADFNVYGTSTTISGSVIPTFNNFTIKSGKTATAGIGLDVNLNFAIEDGATFNDGGLTHTVAGDWTETNTGAMTTGTGGTITFDGTNTTISTLTDATAVNFNHVIFSGNGNVYINNGNAAVDQTTNITGNMQVLGNTNIILQNDANDLINIAGDFTIVATASYTNTISNTTFNGVAQAIDLTGSVSFRDVTFGGSNTKTITGNISTTRNLIVNAGVTVAGAGTHTIANDITMDGICNFSGTIVHNGGNLTSNNATIDMPNLTEYQANADVYIVPIGAALDVTIGGNVTVVTNGLYINNNTSLTGDGTGTFTVSSGRQLYIRDDDGFPDGFSSYILTGSAVYYDADMAQTVRGGVDISYNDLYLDATAPRIKSVLPAQNIIIEDDLDLGSAAVTFDLNGNNMNIAGDVTNAVTGIIDMTDGGTLTFDAENAAQAIGQCTYNLTNLTFTLDNPTVTRAKTIASGSTITMTGNFTTTTGSSSSNILLDVVLNDNSITDGATAPQNMTIGQYCRLSTTAVNFSTSVLDNFDGTVNLLNGIVHYANTTATQYIADGDTYGNLTFSGAQIKQAEGPLDINGNIYITGATTPYFKGAGFGHTIAGNWELDAANMRLADMQAGDTIIFDGNNQNIGSTTATTTNFYNVVFSNSGTATSMATITIYKDLVMNGGSTFNSNTNDIDIYGNWSNSGPGGTFSQIIDDATNGDEGDDGTVSFISTTANQTISSNALSSFGNIVINKNNGAANQTLTALSDIKVDGYIDLTANTAILDMNASNLNIGGYFYARNNINSASNAFVAGSGTVTFDGSAYGQEIQHLSSFPLVFNNLEFRGSTEKNFNCNGTDATRTVDINGNYVQDGPPVRLWPTVTGANFVVFTVAGNWTSNGTLYTNTNTDITFNGGNQDIGSTSRFFDVFFTNGPSTKTLQGNIIVDGNLTLAADVTLDVNAAGDYAINIAGNMDISAAGAIFEAQEGTVTFESAGTPTLTTGVANETQDPNKNFYNITVNGTIQTSGTIDVDHDFTVLSGTYTTNNSDLFVGNDFVVTAGTFTHSNNLNTKVILNATSGPRVFNPGNAGTTAFRSVTINAADASVEYLVSNNFNINGNYNPFYIDRGIFNLNGKTMTVNTASQIISIDAEGTFFVNDDASVVFTNTNHYIQNAGGTLKVVGSVGHVATLTRSGGGTYWVTQSSGTLHAKFYKFEYIGTGANSGITLSGGSLDATNNLSDGSFLAGGSTANTTAYIKLDGFNIDNTTNLTVTNITFDAGGTTNRNFDRDTPPAAPNNGYIECGDCIGSLSGSGTVALPKEIDAPLGGANTGYVRWNYPTGFFWEGDVSDDWHDGANWAGGVVPTDADHYVYFNETYFIGPNPVAVIQSADATCGRLIIEDGGSGLGVALTGGYDLDVENIVSINATGTIDVSDPNSTLYCGGNWTNSGTFNCGTGTVILDAVSGAFNITPGASSFYNFTINSTGGAEYALAGNLDVNNNFTLTEGSLDVLSRDITVGGNWMVDGAAGGILTPQTRTVTLDGTNQNINGGTFYNLTTSGGSGTKTVVSNLDINGTVTIGAGTTLNGSTFDIYVAGNWINNNLFSQTGTGKIIFDGGNQQIDNTGTQTTSFHGATFGGTGTKTFYKASTFSGDLSVNSGSTVNFSTFDINGQVATNTFTNNGTIYMSSNFPDGFETKVFTSSSNTYYSKNTGNQYILSNDDTWSYGNLYLENNSGTNYEKLPTGNKLTVTGALTISHTDVDLNMNSNSTELILTGNLAFPAGGLQIDWGTGTSKLTHVGGNWNIDQDITTFNNLELGGTAGSYKRLRRGGAVADGTLTITGNLTVKNGIYFWMMYDENNRDLFKRVNCTGAGKTLTMESGSRIYNSTPRSAAGNNDAIPTGFTTYSIHSNSSYYLTALNATDQEIYTGNSIEYGNITFQYTKNIFLDGISTFHVNGTLNMGTCDFDDAGQSTTASGDVYLYDYTPSSTATMTLDGPDQLVYNPNLAPVNFNHLTCSGSGTKTIGGGGVADVITMAGNVTIAAGVTMYSQYPITFSGEVLTNGGKIQHTSTFSVTRTALPTPQSINPGTYDATNYFTNVDFSGTNTVTFVGNGINTNGTFTISSTGTVDMGALTHYIVGNIDNSNGGTWTTASANITLDGAGQNVDAPVFEVNDLTITNTAGTGTKRMFCDWIINGDMNITTGNIVNNDNGAATYFDIEAKGNWTNAGTFTHNSNGIVTFNASANVDINNGTSSFHNVVFGDDAGGAVRYSLQAASSTIRLTMDINEDAILDLNGKTLILGYNVGAGKVFTVNGTLEVDADATLSFNNQGSASTMTVNNAGTPALAILRIVGSAFDHVATLNRSAGALGTNINVDNATLEAKYYLIESLATSGMNITTNATLHAVNNLSYGTFSNITNAAGNCYLNLEAGTYTGGDIVDVTFNCATAPVVGIFNVKRNISAPDIRFSGNISGDLGSYLYEDDELTAGPPAIAADTTRGHIRWPGSSSSTWTGTCNSDWDDACNWSNGVPNSSIDAIIPNVTNDPILNVNGSCKKLTITDGFLTLDNSNDLVTEGDITIGSTGAGSILVVLNSGSNITCGGSWTRGATGSFSHGNATVTFNSGIGTSTINPRNSAFNNVVFDNGATTFYITFATASTVTIAGNLSILNSSIVVPNTNGYILNVGGNIDDQGTFTPNNGGVTGTVVLNGTANQTITDGTFYNLTVSGSNIKYVANSLVVTNTTTINSTLEANTGSIIDFNGNVTIGAAGTFNDGGETHTFTGQTWTGTGAYVGTGTIQFDRNGGQFINASTFNNLLLNTTNGDVTMQGDMDIVENMTVNLTANQRFYVNNYVIDNTTAAGVFTLNASNFMRITGANHFPSNFSLYTMATTSTVEYYGASDQTIFGGLGIEYGNLTLNNANTKTLGGEIVIKNRLNFNNATLDASINDFPIEIHGQWDNDNSTGTFVPQGGTVTFKGSTADQYILVGAGSVNPFHNLTVNNASYVVYAPGAINLTIQGDLTAENGTYSANTQITYISGDLVATNGQFANSGTFYLNKAAGTARIKTNFVHSDVAAGSKFINNFEINSAGGCVYTLESDFGAYGNFTITAGTFDAAGYKVNLGNGNEIITINGTYKVGTGGQLGIGWYAEVTVNGTIEVVGAAGNDAKITRNYSGGRYLFTVNGTIKAENYIFEWMTGGIYLTSSSTIDATNHFSNGTFTNGPNDGPMLRIENTQSFTGVNRIENVQFPANPGGAAVNVRKITAASGTLEFYEATGAFSGATFESDANNLINWTGAVVLTWDGSASTDWNTAANWTPSSGPEIVPTGNENVIIATAVNQPILTTSGQLAKKLTINAGATLTFSTDLNASAIDLQVYGDININGTLVLNSTNDFLAVEGSWTKGGGGNITNNGSVIFNGSGSAKTIDNGAATFYNLIIDGTTDYTIGVNTTIRNDVTIETGASFGSSNFTTYVGGNWTNNGGTFTSSSGKVTFNATAGPKNIDAGSSAFNNIDINASNNGVIYNLTNNNVSVKGNLYVATGKLNLNGRILNMGDGAGTDYLTITGIFEIGANGILKMGSASVVNVNSGGTFHAIGTNATNLATVTRQSAGTYTFEVNSGATFGAQYYLFEYMNAGGIYLKPGTTLESSNDMSNGTFANGAAGGTFLKCEIDQLPSHPAEEVIENVEFKTGPAYNVTRTTGSTVMSFQDAFGSLGTYNNENDAVMPADGGTGLIYWTFFNTAVWDGSAGDGNWHTASNWSCNCIPDASKNVTIPVTVNPTPTVSAGAADAKKITINSGATLTVASQNLTVVEDVWYAGTFTATGTPTITVGSDWVSSAGTFNKGSSNVVLTGGGAKALTSASSFYNLEIAGTGTYTLGATTTITNNLTLTSGGLNVSNFNMFVGNNWTNTGATFTAGVKTVYLNGTGTAVVRSNGQAFYNLSKTGTGTVQLGTAMTITNRFDMSQTGTFDLSNDAGVTSYNMTIGERWNVSKGTFNARAANIYVSESWVLSGTGIFTPGTSSVYMNACSGTKTIISRNRWFNKLYINCNATFNLQTYGLYANYLYVLQGVLNTTTNNYPLQIKYDLTNNATLTTNSSIVTFNGGDHQIVSGTGTISFANLVINNTGLGANGIELNAPITVTTALTLTDGTVYPDAVNLLILADNATSTSGSSASFVAGPMKKIGNDAFTFPLGKSGVWAPMAITAPSNTTDAFTGEYFYTASSFANWPCINCGTGITNISIKEYWDLSRTAGVSTPNVTMYFKDLTRSNITDLANIVFAHWDGDSWEKMGTNVGVSDGVNTGYVIGTGFTSYSPNAPASADGSNPLPIELIKFNASVVNDSVSLYWATAAELNNDYFTLERSTDGVNFEVIGIVDGAGNSNKLLHYFFMDNDLDRKTQTYYYRLKQTDFDGKYVYSEIISVLYVNTESNIQPVSIALYPNPVFGNEGIYIEFKGVEENEVVEMIIQDATGKIISDNRIMCPETPFNYYFNFNNTIAAGTYFIEFKGNSWRKHQKLIIQ